jgi:adenine-specific DNA methylase
MTTRPRLLIEEWLPIAEIGIESLRERTPMTPFPAPNRLHVWWARRPLVAARAAVLASLLPADADRGTFMHLLGIHGDPVAARIRIEKATRDGVRLGADAYGYERAFKYTPDAGEKNWIKDQFKRVGIHETPTVLDPTAGGGAIPFEAARVGCNVLANDLNPVAWLIIRATVEFPAKFGMPLHERFLELGREFVKRVRARLVDFYPDEPEKDCIPDGYLWARTITCPYCAGKVPLSPNWRLNAKGKGVRLVPAFAEATAGKPDTNERVIRFEMVNKLKDHSAGTVKGGDGLCPFPDCGRVIDGDEIKAQAQAGQMGQQLYAVVYNRLTSKGRVQSGKNKGKEKFSKERGFRAPRPEDDVEAKVQAELDRKMPEWLARNIVPTEEIAEGYETTMRWPLDKYGLKKWTQMFSPRQLLGHCTSVEVLHDLIDEARAINALSPIDSAAFCYLACALDKLLNYGCYSVRWIPQREVVAGMWDRHDFSVKWSYAELSPCILGLGYDWAIEQTGKAVKELIDLIQGEGHSKAGTEDDDLFTSPPNDSNGENNAITITCGSGDTLARADASVDAIVMDPPYYNNVTYSELSDFFYVWLKRTAGCVLPEAFFAHLVNKDQEAVANPFRFRGQKQALKLAGRDYQTRMAAIFRECRRVLKPHGVMTVMFTHKASGAWDALSWGLVDAGFVITASWPVNTEAEGSLHIKEKSAAKSTIFLVCRPREDYVTGEDFHGEPASRYWEDVEPLVMKRVREKVATFQEAGITGVDLYLACFGPALEVFSENWPLTRGKPVPEPKGWDADLFTKWDPYTVRPEDALDAARREVKRWRMEHLASVKRQHHLDPLTEWYLLAWDAFRAPRFPADEALKLARVVGLDFDQDVKNRVCEVKGSDVVMWDSKTRRDKGKLGMANREVMLDALQQAAVAGRDGNTGAAKKIIEEAGLLEDATFLTALEAALNVLPPIGGTDFDALEKLRRLAFAEQIPEPEQMSLFVEAVEVGGDGQDEQDLQDGEDG